VYFAALSSSGLIIDRWYNVPLSPSRLQQSASTTAVPPISEHQTSSRPEAEYNSQPIDFDSFVPTHDPSLVQDFSEAMEANTMPSAAVSLPNVTADEAFSKALDAMYWTGYWTAVYHVSTRVLYNLHFH
jgi:hypothetical protein